MGLPSRDTDQLPTRTDQTRSAVRDDKHPGHRQPGAELLPDAPLHRGQRCAASLGACPGNNSPSAAAGTRLPQPAAIGRDGRRVVERPRKADPRIGQHRPQMLRRADAPDRLPTVAGQRPRGGDRIDKPGMVFEGAGVAPRTGWEALGRLGKRLGVALRRDGDGGRDRDQIAVGEQVGGPDDEPRAAHRRRPSAGAGPEHQKRRSG